MRLGIVIMRRFALIALFLLSGCSPIQLQLHEDDVKVLTRDPKVYVITFKSPAFEVDTSTNLAVVGGMLGGALGALATGAAVNVIDEANMSADIQKDARALVRSGTYEDPVMQVRDDFVRIVRDDLKISKFVVVEEPLDDSSTKALSDRFHDGIVLGFRTEEWVLMIVPLSSDFGINYRASGVFYLPEEKRYMWRELCGVLAKESRTSLGELAANSGEGLKDRLKDTGKRCAKQLAADVIDRIADRAGK